MDHMKFETPDLTAQNIDKLAALFPGCVTEGPDGKGGLKKAINFELLKQMLSDDVLEGDEAYEFTWVGKKASIVEANKPIRKTLRPCPEKSKNWDTTENLYIEGDNLEVLKLLQEAYLGKVKMIYIDPPYNTGHDFIYNDRFEMDKQEYDQQIGLFDEEGNKQFAENSESNPRFHSDWCSMMYPRLMLARNMLADDGVIFISIDDNECADLLKICNEIFSESNFVADISWQRTYSMRNDAKGIPAEVEHILVYSKSVNWQPQKLERTVAMDSKYKNPDHDPKGPWRNIVASAPDSIAHQGMVYAIQNPITGELNYPPQGRHWSLGQEQMLESMCQWCDYELVDLKDYEARAKVCNVAVEDVRKDVLAIVLKDNLAVSQQKVTEIYKTGPLPEFFFSRNGKGTLSRKAYLQQMEGRPVTNLWPHEETGHTDEASRLLKAMFNGTAVFDTPKPVRLLNRILTIATDKESLIMDFFSGSATTAHAVIQKNAEDGGHRKFILVQLPEKSPSPQYDTLCDVGIARIRRAGEKIVEEQAHLHNAVKTGALQEGKAYAEFTTSAQAQETQQKIRSTLDIGFRVLKLDDTNMEDVYYSAQEYSQDMLQHMESNIKPDRTDLDLLFGCLLEWGLPLSMPYRSEQMEGCTVHTYNVGDLIACFDENIPESVIREIAKRKPLRAVFRDSGFATSPEKINVGEIFKLLAPDTRVKVI